MIAARFLFAMLFVGGCFFAFFVWILIPTPLGALLPEYRFGYRDIVLSVAGCGLALTGYFVWLNWLLFAIRGRFFPGSGIGVQIIAFMDHLGWLILLPIFRQTNLVEFACELPWVAFWIFSNMTIACIAAMTLIVHRRETKG